MKLIISTESNQKFSIGLADASQLIDSVLVDKPFMQAELVLKTIDNIFRKHKITKRKLKEIIVISGPGDFSAVRIGISVANALGYAWNKPVKAVEVKKKYFYPVGEKGWPEPPNYMAFRYKGKLQYICHVESYEIVEQLHDSIKEIEPDNEEPLHYVLKLGPRIIPSSEVKNGKIWPNGRYWCMLDTLLTCKTVKEARDLTKKRLGEN